MNKKCRCGGEIVNKEIVLYQETGLRSTDTIGIGANNPSRIRVEMEISFCKKCGVMYIPEKYLSK